jgi:hypothetical protein
MAKSVAGALSPRTSGKRAMDVEDGMLSLSAFLGFVS